MKNLLTLFTLLFLVLPIFAQDIDTIPLEKMRKPKISVNLPKPKTFREKLSNLFYSTAEQEQKSSLAFYLYNMEISDIKQNQSVPLSLENIGAFDFLSMLNKKPSSLTDLYLKDKEEIYEKLDLYFQTFEGRKNTLQHKKILSYLSIADKSYLKSKKYVYAPASIPAFKNATKNKTIKSIFEKTKLENENLVYPMQVLDNTLSYMDGPLIGNRSMYKTEYHKVSDECSVCAYNMCKNICLSKNSKSFNILRIYRFYAYNKNGIDLVSSNGGNFISPKGKKYPSWTFHASALIISEEEGKIYFTILDPLLSKDLISLDAWQNFFDKETTVFEAIPFQRVADTEQKMRSK